MADLSAMQSEAGTGPLSRRARMQYAALAWMRWRMMVNGLRSIRGVFELGATGITILVYGTLGIGLGVGLGVGAYSIAIHAQWLYLPILFWVVFVLWQVIPLAVTSLQQAFSVNSLLRFPVSFGSFYLLHLIFGLADVSTILGVLCSLGIWTGMVLARPGLMGWVALDLAIFGAFNVVLVRAVLAWIERWLIQRRTREILSAVFLLFLVGLQLLNPGLRQNGARRAARHEVQTAQERKAAAELTSWVKIVDVVQAWLPPGQAGRMLERAGEREAPAALESMAALSLYVLLVGGVLAARLRAEYRGENLGEAPAPSTATKRQKKRLLDGSGPLAAVMEKEFQTMMRSARLLFALGVPVLMVLVIATLLRNGDSGAQHSILRSLDLPLCEAYALLGFTQLIYNTLGTEGTGIQLIFLSPTPIRTVMLAKNLFHGMLFGIVAVLAGVLTMARVGRPDWPVLAATAGWLVFALPANLAAGNILSLILPYRVNLGRMMHQAGSQGNGLFAMLIQAAILGVGISVYGVCSLFAHEWLAAPIFLALAGAAIIAWLRVLRHVDGMAGRRKDLLMDALAEAAK